MDSSFHRSASQLESLIAKLENHLGVPPRASPLQSYLAEAKKLEEKASANQQIKKKKNQKKKKQKNHSKNTNKSKQPKKNKNQGKKALKEFINSEFRVGKILKSWKNPESDKLYFMEIDIGSEVRTIASGIQKYYTLEEIIGLCVVWANVKAKKMPGFDSHGIMMCLNVKGVDEKEKLQLFRPPDSSQVGDRVFLEGHEAECTEEALLDVMPSNAVYRVTGRIRTDKEGYLVYEGKRLVTKDGYLKNDQGIEFKER